MIFSANKYIIAVDIGNTSTAAAVLKKGRPIRLVRLLTSETSKKQIIKTTSKLIKDNKAIIDGAIISSVVPSCDELWLNVLNDFNPLILTHNLKMGFRARYPNINSLGADRIANVSAAVVKYKAPMVIVDIGTAVTFDVVNSRYEFIGGVIAPGPKLFLAYMNEKTAKLPQINVDSFKNKGSVIGKNTKAAMKSAFVYGYPAMLDGILNAIEHQLLKGKGKMNVIVTGGFAKREMFYERKVYMDEFLIFEGLYRIWLLNFKEPS